MLLEKFQDTEITHSLHRNRAISEPRAKKKKPAPRSGLVSRLGLLLFFKS
jgi:hypothetical protein